MLKQNDNDRLSVLLCANVRGSDNMMPLTISKSACPWCFGKIFEPNVYVTYTNDNDFFLRLDCKV